MKILNLVLFSDDKYYQEMYEITSVYNKKFENTKTIYYKFSSNINNDYELINDVLHIKSDTDTFIPGILNKTVLALEYADRYLNVDEYDYIIRSNISTIIDYEELFQELLKNPVKFYGGGCVHNLQVFGYGIVDKTWFGTPFASGTSIIMTKQCLKFIINHKDKLRYDIIDDVAIGILMREYAKDVVAKSINSLYFMPLYIKDNIFYYDILKKNIYDNKYIFYRNKVFDESSSDRTIDLFQMKHIIKTLEEKNLHI